MMTNVNKLLSNASASLGMQKPNISNQLRDLAGILADELLNMLNQRNGFYALESALHVFPTNSNNAEVGLDKWNEKSLWRSDYQGLADDCLFFAEDVFGVQFCIKDGKVYTFDPETAALDYLADDIEHWAKAIISDHDVLTGYSLAHQWQKKKWDDSFRKTIDTEDSVCGRW